MQNKTTKIFDFVRNILYSASSNALNKKEIAHVYAGKCVAGRLLKYIAERKRTVVGRASKWQTKSCAIETAKMTETMRFLLNAGCWLLERRSQLKMWQRLDASESCHMSNEWLGNCQPAQLRLHMNSRLTEPSSHAQRCSISRQVRRNRQKWPDRSSLRAAPTCTFIRFFPDT